MTILISFSDAGCEFKAIFNFGDSNSDTGGFWAAFPAQSGPFGMTYFNRPTGRATDGRLMVDFLAQALGFPFLSPYLQSIGSDYQHGANYATLASTVLLPNTSQFVTGISPFSLAIQLNQMKEFKTKVYESDSTAKIGSKLPKRDVFGKSIYMFYIGQNDFTSNLPDIDIHGTEQFLPQVVSQIADTIKELYDLGGRTFLVLNLAPVGCYPAVTVRFPRSSSEVDKFGCKISYNKAVVDYNDMLKKKLAETRSVLVNAEVIYVDVYSVLLDLFQRPTSYGYRPSRIKLVSGGLQRITLLNWLTGSRSYGLKNGVRACCGYGEGVLNFNPQVYCGNTKVIDGIQVTARACRDPQNYVSWDGIHATEVANKIVTQAILNGSIFYPPFSLGQQCDLNPIG
ncbi:hypothetical protein ACFE04_010005 [Oxalis oulophora]